jgi:hypothetical protein
MLTARVNLYRSNTRLVVDLRWRREAGRGDGLARRVLLKIVYVRTCRTLGLIIVLFRGGRVIVA